ncbi:MAG: peptidase S41 [Acidobacteria bacterium]|nr:peptidase S41 [Acidobacteriota bacterium]MYJ05729.1 peptidase S41 [Acidobacteriota bacterium]
MFRRFQFLMAPCVVGMLAATVVPAAAQTKLLRFPDIHGDRVVFTYAGDLWLAPTAGGQATRLTAHPGLELFARFSPDGSRIAFTGQYDGDEQVYVIPATGGVPQQITYYPARGPLAPRWGYDNQVYDWSPDGQAVLFRSLRYSTDLSDSRLFLASVDGGLPIPLEMPESGAGDLSPDGSRVVYSPLFRDFRTWKRYEGGWAQELYIFDRETHVVERVTTHRRADRDPMWIGNAIYFTSDRDGTLNLYRYDVGSRETTQLTESDTWDVRWPGDDGANRIVYELNGELEIYSIDAGTSQPIAITVPDDGLAMRPSRVAAAALIEDAELSPGGERALFVARGDVFTAPIENGPTRNLTRSSSAHDKWARWSPDGRRIAYVSDASGEDEIYLVAQDGSGEPEQLTTGGQAMRYAPEWSPTGDHLAFSDKDGRLYVIDVETQEVIDVADEERGLLRDYVWSPRGGYLAFSMTDATGFSSIYVWSLAEGELHRVTGEYFHEWNPAWDPDGDFLYYLSDRQFTPQLGSFEWNYLVDRETGIYAAALRRDVEHPLPPESDEVELSGDDPDADEDDGEGDDPDADDEHETADPDDDAEGAGEGGHENGDEDEEGPIAIDFDGLAQRVVRLPVPFDNYVGLSGADDGVFFIRGGPQYYGRGSSVQPALRRFTFADREAETIADGIGGYAVSRDGERVLVREGNAWNVYPAGGGDATRVSTNGLMVDRVPAEEWAQIFDEVWRRFRDFFYVDNMHGYDWDALRDRYRPMLEHVGHRSDLNYVIGEMVAELNVSHAYIAGGDWETPDRPEVALPGAVFELDAQADRYRIVEIFAGHNEEPRYRSPLTEIGVDARVGDYVLAIDGEDLLGSDNPYRVLRHRADRPVRLTLHAEPTFEGAREVSYTPVTQERSLRYLTEVEANRQKVAEMTDGRVGYLHVPDMGAEGIQEFIKWFYGQIRKEGLVIDVRGNGGGNVSQMLIERLRRDVLGTSFSRTYDTPETYPQWAFHGHLVCILDEDSASDGDIFPYRFREAGLGPLIGKRSWGGVIGITSHGPLIDGGSVNVPQFGTNGADGSWVVENVGVEPDIEVENDPRSVIAGQDPQLERAVEEVLRMMREDPKALPQRPAPPVKTP